MRYIAYALILSALACVVFGLLLWDEHRFHKNNPGRRD